MEQLGKYIKIGCFTFLALFITILIAGVLTLSHPFFLNTYVNLLVKCSGSDPDTFDFHTYSKEEFAAEFLNTTLTSDDDFIALFENRYRTENKFDAVLIFFYRIQDPQDSSTCTIYGVNKFTDLVFKNTFKEYTRNENTEISEQNKSTSFNILKNPAVGNKI